MCGIAGYHVSKSWAKKYINEENMERILQEAWFHNIHRGYEAAGFFSVDTEDHCLTFKSPGTAAQIFQSDIKDGRLLEPAHIFAAHTRSPSHDSGHPDINENNHPVIWDDVWVTHNGTIENDDDIKTLLKGNVSVPKVDSIAIPMVLAETSPEKFDEVLLALSTLVGTFSIHALWNKHPRYSVLARNNHKYPLVFAEHNSDQAFVYGSEPASVWHIIRMMDLNPNDKAWTWRTLDPGHAMLLEDGKPVAWGAFNTATSTYGSTSRLEYEMERWLPKDKQSARTRVKVYSTNKSYDYINKASNFSFKNKKAQSLDDLLYTQADGFTDNADKNIKFPFTGGEIAWGAIFCEADKIYKDGDMLHALYGDIEIVISESGRVVRDVFNHSQYNNSQRWTKIKTEEIVSDTPSYHISTLDWDSFRKVKSTAIPVMLIPTKIEDYQYIEELWAHSKLTGLQNAIGTGDTHKTKVIVPQILLTWDNVAEQTTIHEKEPTLLFLGDIVCKKHDEKYSIHKDPFACSALMYAASFCMAAMIDVDMYSYIDKLIIEYNFSDEYAGCKQECWYVESEIVIFGNDGIEWEVTTAETCYMCHSTRTLKYLPSWAQYITHSKRMESIYVA